MAENTGNVGVDDLSVDVKDTYNQLINAIEVEIQKHIDGAKSEYEAKFKDLASKDPKILASITGLNRPEAPQVDPKPQSRPDAPQVSPEPQSRPEAPQVDPKPQSRPEAPQVGPEPQSRPDYTGDSQGYDPNTKLPWFKHGMKGFFRKLWHGDHPDNPSWKGYKAEHMLTLEECLFLNEQISNKLSQLSNQFLTEDFKFEDNDAFVKKIQSLFVTAVNQARKEFKTSPKKNPRGAGRPLGDAGLLNYLNASLKKMGIQKVENIDDAIGLLKDKLEGIVFNKPKDDWIVVPEDGGKFEVKGKRGRNIIDKAIANYSADLSVASEKPVASEPAESEKPAESRPSGNLTRFSDKKANSMKKVLLKMVSNDDEKTREIFKGGNWKQKALTSDYKEYFQKWLDKHNEQQENENEISLENLKNKEYNKVLTKISSQAVADLISEFLLKGKKSPEEVLGMEEEDIINMEKELQKSQKPDEPSKPDTQPKSSPVPGPSTLTIDDHFELDSYKSNKIVEQLNPHHKMQYYKKLLACGIRPNLKSVNLSEVSQGEKVNYLKEKLKNI